MTTPEGKIKRKVTELLRAFEAYYFMPVQSGYGSVSLDYLCCYKGRFFAIETKRKGAKPTDRQQTIIEQIQANGGVVFVIDDDESITLLKYWLKGI